MSEGSVGESGRMALQLIRDHILECTQARIDTKGAIKELRNWLVAGFTFAFVVLVGAFAYEYQRNEAAETARAQETGQIVAAVKDTGAQVKQTVQQAAQGN